MDKSKLTVVQYRFIPEMHYAFLQWGTKQVLNCQNNSAKKRTGLKDTARLFLDELFEEHKFFQGFLWCNRNFGRNAGCNKGDRGIGFRHIQ